MLKWHIIKGWPHTKDEVEPDKERYWLIRYKLVAIDGINMKGKQIIVLYTLQKQILEQFYSNHMGIKNVMPNERGSILDQHE